MSKQHSPLETAHEIISRILKERNSTIREFGLQCGWSHSRLPVILRNQRSVTVETAKFIFDNLKPTPQDAELLIRYWTQDKEIELLQWQKLLEVVKRVA